MESFDEQSLIEWGIGLSAAQHRLQQSEVDGDLRDQTAALADLAAASDQAEKLEQALRELDHQLGVAEAKGDARAVVLNMMRKGALLVRTHRLDEGLGCLDQALFRAVAADDPAMQRDVQVRRSLVLGKLGRYPEALELLESLLGSGAGIEADLQAQLLGIKGDLLSASGQDQAAQQAFERAIDCSATAARPRLGLARALISQAKFVEASQALVLALKESRQAGEQQLEWEILRTLIDLDVRLGTTEQLLEHSRLAQAHAESRDDHVEASIQRGNAISALLELGRFEEALAMLHESLEYVSRRGPRAKRILLLIQLGRVHYELKEYGKAEEAYKAALELAELHSDSRSTATCLGRLGALYGDQGDLQAARRYGELALEKVDGRQDPEIAAEQNILLALTYRDLDERQLAHAACRRAIDLYEQLEDQAFIERGRALLAELEQ